MISVRKVTKEYRLDENTKITPVKEVDLEVKKGEFVMIVGRSGSGKTTLLNLCAGLIKPTSGQVFIDGVDIGTMNDGQLSELRSKKIGFIFQFQSLFSNLTIQENVAIPALSTKASANPRKRAAELLRMVGLSDRMNVYPKQLSAGELRRVAIARALMNKPEILLADEPTADLDEQTERTIVALLHRIHQSGMTILMITHNMDLVPDCTRALKVEKGDLKPFRHDEIKFRKISLTPDELMEREQEPAGSGESMAAKAENRTGKLFEADETSSRKTTLTQADSIAKDLMPARSAKSAAHKGTELQKQQSQKKPRVSNVAAIVFGLSALALAVFAIRFVPGLVHSSQSQVQGTSVATQGQITQTLNLVTVSAALGKEFSLREGQTATINEEKMSFKFTDVTGDSRCPQGAKCYSPGQINFIVEFTSVDGNSSINLPLVQLGQNDSTTATFDKYTLTFRVDPYPVAGKTISNNEYILNIVISTGDVVPEPLKSNKPKGPSM
jgi:ABC-type lipoprotein export system ATPase subunit